MKNKCLVLVSGGLDSAVCLAMAIKNFGKENVEAACIYYGQKHRKEILAATHLCNHYGVHIHQKDISSVMEEATSCCSLMDGSKVEMGKGTYKEQIDNGDGIVNTYVPFRNGLFLSVASSMAYSLFSEADNIFVYYGAHLDDCAGDAYADCSERFVEKMDEAIREGTYCKVKIKAPFIDLHYNKADIVKKGKSLNVPFELTWSCYNGGDKACGQCATCKDRLKAFAANGIKDPIDYEDKDIANKIFVAWESVEKYIDAVAQQVQLCIETNNMVLNSDDKVKDVVPGVYGIPRGGTVLATMLSHKLGIPLLAAPTENCIIIDDICDSGETIKHYVSKEYGDKGYYVTTMFYNKKSGLKLDYTFMEKVDAWIVYPWENLEV